MKKIQLSQGRCTFVDDSDYNFLNQHKWFAKKLGNTYYAMRNYRKSDFKRGTMLMHRLILNVPDGMQTDHINGYGLDNRHINLRFCTRSENMRNQRLHSGSSTRFKGVTLFKGNRKKPYHARIRVNNKILYLGYYRTPEKAARAYDTAARKHHGEFGLTNEMLGLL